MSPQRAPVTMSPTMLMSPMVFSQSKSAKGGIDCSPAPAPPAPQTLNKSQLQATLLHLIQVSPHLSSTRVGPVQMQHGISTLTLATR